MKLVRSLSLLAALALLFSACGPEAESTSSADLFLTEGVNTIVASYFGTQTAAAPVVTATVPPSGTPFPSATLQPLPTAPLVTPTFTFVYYTLTATPYTITPTGTFYTATTNVDVLAYGCKNLLLIADVNYPSGTEVKPGENFTKTWKVSNNGTCEWQYVFALTQTGGSDFDAPNKKLGKVVGVNEWTEISLNLDAPKKEGTYTAYWRMSDGEGHLFGSTLGVTVVVKKDAYP